jgi:hypothetical protein
MRDMNNSYLLSPDEADRLARNLATIRETAASPELQAECRKRAKAASTRIDGLAGTARPARPADAHAVGDVPAAVAPPATAEPDRRSGKPGKWHPRPVTPGSRKDRLRQFDALPLAEQHARLYADA